MVPELGIAWVPASSSTIVRLRGIAPPRSTIIAFQDEVALLEALTKGGIALTVVEAGGSTHDLAVRALRRVHDAFPQHPLVAWCNFNTIQSSQLLDVARSGVQDIVRHQLDELKFSFARIFANATQRAVGTEVSEMLRDVVPTRLQPILEYALEHADEHLDRDTVAAVFGVSPRTLHDRLTSAGLPSTHRFLMWCRLLIASALLNQPGHTLDSVAGQLGFTDGHNLGNRLRRYTGHGITALREGGSLEATVSAFLESLTAGSR
jgi:AraC-like DNA-binding protein